MNDACALGHARLKVSDNRGLLVSPRLFANPLASRHAGARGGGAIAGFTASELEDVATFAPGRPATPLRDVPGIAAAMGVSRLLVKDETARWGLDAFKITGASYAIDRWRGPAGAAAPPLTLLAASAGNHGRAVARTARERGLACRIYVPADARADRIAAILADAAEVVQLAGSYEDALLRAAHDAREPGTLLVSDTASAGDAGEHTSIPALIVRGYTRVFAEAAAVWDTPPDVIVVQGGVGGLVAAAAGWMRAALPSARLIAAEPEGADCLRASARAGRSVTLDSTRATSMVYLRCAEPSAAAWPLVAAGVDAFVAVDDEEAARAVTTLESAGIRTGPSGACGLAALAAAAPAFRGKSALVVATEGR